MASGDKLLDLSFNGNTTDTGPSAKTVVLTGGGYEAGRIDGALVFNGPGVAEIRGTTAGIIPLAGEYTLTAWVRAEQTGAGPTESALIVKFAGANRYLYLNAYSSLTSWTYVVIAQSGIGISLLINGRESDKKAFPTGWGKPTGWALVNDNPSVSGGFVALEDVRVFDGVLANQFVPVAPSLDIPLVYSINGQVFARFGVYVSASNGLVDNLNRKPPLQTDWEDYHGDIVDLSTPRYQAREISLSCFLPAIDRTDFIDRLNLFLDQFVGVGTQRLMVEVHSSKPLVYEVYCTDTINLKKKWTQNGMVGEFELKLREAEPIKRVLKKVGPGSVTLTFTSTKSLTIFWGDGTVARDVAGEKRSLSHTYTVTGTYYIIVAGVIEDITDFTANCPVVWNKL